MVYLDNAATTRVCPEAAEAAVHMMTECFGNPSTTYKLGREAKAAVDKARGQIAKALGCQPDEVYFTSCGSEGDNWALISGARYMRRRGKHIISSAVEHDAVRKSLDFLEKEGYEITRLQPDGTGAIPLEAVRAALRPDTILVSLMMVNNETGAVNDIAAVARMLKAENSIALLHTDAVQGFLKVPFSAKTLGADMITISGHKIHAPKGIGALYIRSGLKLPPYILGGGQELAAHPAHLLFEQTGRGIQPFGFQAVGADQLRKALALMGRGKMGGLLLVERDLHALARQPQRRLAARKASTQYGNFIILHLVNPLSHLARPAVSRNFPTLPRAPLLGELAMRSID
jgi:selenocysteine lyase/cysteine desulfurase